MSFNYRLILVFVCVLSTEKVVGQNSVTLPSTPAFSILNFEPASVMRPGNPRDLASDILNSIFTLRPHPKYEKELGQSGNCCKMVLEKLNDETITDFIRGYLGEDGILPESLRHICRSRDGTYQPILIRLAIHANEQETTDIAGLYEATIRKLIKNRIPDESVFNELMAATYKLCIESYM